MSALPKSGRKDHFSPRGYLRGFIHPNRADDEKPLWVLDIPSRSWSLRSPAEFGYVRRLYDYSDSAARVVTAEDAFRRPENDFPTVRGKIRSGGYDAWIAYRDDLLRFGAMLSARTPMFLGQVKAASGLDDSAAAQDNAVDSMRAEIADRFVRWRELHWALRYTPDPDDSVVTADQAVGMEGPAPSAIAAASDPGTTLFVPLARDICLFGAVVPLSPLTARFVPYDLERLRQFVYFQATEFVVATLPLF
jgi:hypothetical protein